MDIAENHFAIAAFCLAEAGWRNMLNLRQECMESSDLAVDARTGIIFQLRIVLVEAGRRAHGRREGKIDLVKILVGKLRELRIGFGDGLGVRC